MGAFYYEDPADRPYGPGNPDYEYDGWRAERDWEEDHAWPFPAPEVPDAQVHPA